MYNFHQDKPKYFNWQYLVSRDHIIPFIKEFINIDSPIKVLEVGCAEAGVLKAFIEKGHSCTGIELSESRANKAQEFMSEAVEKGQLKIISKNIYDIDYSKEWEFDLVILKDVIEHIHDQEKFIGILHKLLNNNGKVFFAFPPWHMPFGGHQQMCTNSILSKTPYFHLFPKPIYKFILKVFNEPENKIKGLLEIKDTGISLERFEKIIKKENYKILKRSLFLTNPIYKFKFGIKTKKQFGVITFFPFIRNFFTTCGYYLIEKNSK